MEFACTPEALARARKKLARPALTNPALRDVLEKLEGGLRFDGSDVLLPYLYDQTATLGDYARAKTLSAVVEPRSLFDDATHAYDDLTGRAKGRTWRWPGCTPSLPNWPSDRASAPPTCPSCAWAGRWTTSCP